VLGVEWLRMHHRRLRTTGFMLTAQWGSPPLGPSACAGWIAGGFVRGLNLDDRAASDHVVAAWAQFLLFGRMPSWGCFGRRQARGDAVPLAALSLRRFAAGAFTSFHLLQTRQLAVWLPPQLQHLSCRFDLLQVPDGCASLQATHLGA
jgi:hypothetical protein